LPALASTFNRLVPLRLIARILALTSIALPLIKVALTLQLTIGHVSAVEAAALLSAFFLLEAIVLFLVTRVFRTVP